MVTKQTIEVEGRRLVLSNLEKVLYPGAHFTKAHVIHYYIRVAPWLLPHLEHRPVTMHRFPDGVAGKAFYEKDAPKHTPPWVHRAAVPRTAGGESIQYVCINDLPTLVWVANLASLELHPFLHVESDIGRPQSVVFDLDPGEGATLVNCAEIAERLRVFLEAMDLQCFPKVSGSKGLQVYVPLNTATNYDATRSFARSIAQVMERELPRLVVSEMAKNLRAGKVFIDWSQNSDFKTTIGVYSLRAKNDAPFVSAPVTWKELEQLRKKRDPFMLRFAPAEVLARLERDGDLFAPLLSMKQKLPKKVIEQSPAGKPTPAAGAKPRSQMDKPTTADAELESLPKIKARFVQPMLLLRTEKLSQGQEWLYEVKLDGYRALAIKTGGKVHLRSRNDNDFNGHYPSIVAGLRGLPDETVVDGEVVAIDETGKPSFNLLQNYTSSKAPILYYAFDVLVLNGRNLMDLPLHQRRALLEEHVLGRLEEPIRYSVELQASLSDLIRSVRAQGLEGIVAKRRDSTYESGKRTGAWQKMRTNQGQEFVIGGYTIGGKTFDAVIFGLYEGRRLIYAARTRNGFTPQRRSELMDRFRALEIKECPFANLPEPRGGRWGQGLTADKMKECRWLKPVLVGQFEFVEWTPDDHLRHSKFIALREDKRPRDVVRETDSR